MSLLKHLASSDEILQLARLEECGPGQALMRALTAERDRVRKENEEHPRIDDADLTRDFRFRSGMVLAYSRVLGLTREARDKIEKADNQQGGKT
jgi:hypothetical protein